jgi:hypothetical protein
LTVRLEDIDPFHSAMLAFLEHYDMMRCPVNALPALLHNTWQDVVRRGAFSSRHAYDV